MHHPADALQRRHCYGNRIIFVTDIRGGPQGFAAASFRRHRVHQMQPGAPVDVEDVETKSFGATEIDKMGRATVLPFIVSEDFETKVFGATNIDK